jgi:HAD superfamily hydrolase (TIGR01509 family)
MSIQFVYFDLGNILLSFDPEIACRNLSDRFGVSVDQAREAIYESGLQTDYESGRVSCDRYASIARERMAIDADEFDPRDLLVAVSDMFNPIEPMVDLIARVRRKTGAVGLLSNTCHAHWTWIRSRQEWQVSQVAFDVTILSYEVGSMKPDRRIYETAEAAAGVPTDRILFIDDKHENVDAARRRGWKAEQCFGGKEAEDAITKWLEL